MPADRIATALRDLAATLPEGARLPSVRELMREHGASPVTVQRAIAALAAEGLVAPRPGRGTFVAAPPARDGTPDLGWQEVALGAARTRGRRRAGRAAGRAARGRARALLRLPRPARSSRPRRSRRRSPAPAAARARGSAGRSRASRRCGRGSRARRAGASAPTTSSSAPAARPRSSPPCARSRRPAASVVVESPTYRGALAGVRAAGLTPVPVPERRRRRAARSCSPTRSSAPAPAWSTCSRCTPTRTAPTCRRSGAPR